MGDPQGLQPPDSTAVKDSAGAEILDLTGLQVRSTWGNDSTFCNAALSERRGSGNTATTVSITGSRVPGSQHSMASWQTAATPQLASDYKLQRGAAAKTVDPIWFDSEACGYKRDALQQNVHEDALHRQITALEVRASEAIRARAEREGNLERGKMLDARAQAERQARLREHQRCLQRQIEANERRRQ